MLGSTITQNLLYDRVEVSVSDPDSNGSVDPGLHLGRPKNVTPKKGKTLKNDV
jgi:hypothetical protein